ncbi:TadG family pilus assembly protein [Lignipirellula cremea]|uniref:von Willebrand factor type A domain protein n=1 Tax=Lignipirellula cremea TaxID=2528010 RepID=A0A518E2D9_9BACT|nr:pilus assembly protein TadG-related protein [Lignipirellula cremea]QDU98259.1 von Willebrand factor type A domain protein [Lignipirellula cremea]
MLSSARNRKAQVVVWAALMMVFVVGMVAFAVDVGYMLLTRSQLQNAADSAAIAGAAVMSQGTEAVVAEAQEFAAYHVAASDKVKLDAGDVEFGVWDSDARKFEATIDPGNAIRVTVRREKAALFFGRVFGHKVFSTQASAVATATPRDIALVVDLSGSMNDDTEPAWATTSINKNFDSSVGSDLMQDLYTDLGFGKFPGNLQHLGASLGVKPDKYAYAEMTKDEGPLASVSIPPAYRIAPTDTEAVRKQKAYSWLINYEIAPMMPAALPQASTGNYKYWEKYLDYLILPVKIVAPRPPAPPQPVGPKPVGPKPTPPKPTDPPPPKPPIGWILPGDESLVAAWSQSPLAGVPESHPAVSLEPLAFAGDAAQALLLASQSLGDPGSPPIERGWLPPSQSGDRITGFNNPNKTNFPDSSTSLPRNLRNYIGYLTYAQFMADHGRDSEPAGFSPLSMQNPFCPLHEEATAGGVFQFPPRTQPMHAARRALIAAIQVVKERNKVITNHELRDWVSVISFDTGSGLVQEITPDYDAAMKACVTLQAVSDKAATTATESGLIYARAHIRQPSEGGKGRAKVDKVVVLLTDGAPNLYESDKDLIDGYSEKNGSADFYGGGYYWYDAPLMQSALMQADHWRVFPVGIGLGADYTFMDRLARMGGAANDKGESARGSGNPAEYEQRLTEILEAIINQPTIRLVD